MDGDRSPLASPCMDRYFTSNEKKVEKKVQTFDQFRKRLASQRQEQINTNKKAKKNKAVARGHDKRWFNEVSQWSFETS